MAHRQSVIAEIISRLPQGEMHPHTMRHFQPRRVEGRFHSRNQIRIGRSEGPTPHEVVVASRHQRCERDRSREAFASFLETTGLGEPVTEEILRQRVGRIQLQHLSQQPLGCNVTILRQERSCRAKASEPSLWPRLSRAAEAAYCLVTMAHRVDQGTRAEPCLSQLRLQLGGTVVSHDGRAEITQLFEGNSQPEVRVRVARVARDSALKCIDGLRHKTDLQAGQAQVVLN